MTSAARFLPWLLGAGALGSALNAGVFFAFSAFVMPAFARLPPAQAAAAMQAINVVILRSGFMPLFLGTAAIAGIVAAMAAFAPFPPGTRAPAAIGALIFLAGGFGVTMLCNVPLNDQLAAAGAARWPAYLAEWTTWNSVRALACGAAAAALGIAARS